MDAWFIIIVSLCLSLIIKAILNLLFTSQSSSSPSSSKLPPGPFNIPIISSFLWHRKSLFELEPVLKNLHAKYGPIFSLPIGSRRTIFIADRSLAHQVLVQSGAIYSDRPSALATDEVESSKQHNINSASYGPNWRSLRRNLTSQILHPSRLRSFSGIRKSVLAVLLSKLQADSGKANVRLIDHFQYAMFCLLVLMCFGENVDVKKIREIENVLRASILNKHRFNCLNYWPKITKILFRKRWEEFLKLLGERQAVMAPLISERRKAKEMRLKNPESHESVLTYVDTLLDLQLPEENRKLSDDELVALCVEFIVAGTDTTTTALQWTMANLVKNPNIQQKVLQEIKDAMGDDRKDEKEVKEEDLHKLQYLKAVILEALRRHPPAHFLAPHAVTEDAILNGYLVPKKATVNFMVAEMGWDPNVWEDPMEFKPERFLNEKEVGFDITGSKEIKMMPFGAGRRICPGMGLAMLHLEYFVANLVWNFEWQSGNEDSVIDFSEKNELTVVMKNPLQVRVVPRI